MNLVENSGSMIFRDAGETGRDASHLATYREKLLEVDIVLWSIHADTRSISFDQETLHTLLDSFDPVERAVLMGKVTFALTKADLITATPWTLALVGPDECIFVPSKETSQVLLEKAHYFWEGFLSPYKHLIPSQAPYPGHFSVALPGFQSDGKTVFYQGMIDAREREQFAAQYPQYADVFERLYFHHGVIPCSARFRYNLDQLMLAIIDKIGNGVSFRLNRFLKNETLSRLSFKQARQYCNLVVLDEKQRKVLFDLSTLTGCQI